MPKEIKNKGRVFNELMKINGKIKRRSSKGSPGKEVRSSTTEARKKYNAIVMELLSRMRLQRELQVSQELFAKAFHSTPLIMAIRSQKDGRLIEVNKTFLKATGFLREELIDHNPFEMNIWSNLDREEIETLTTGESKEINFVTKAGDVKIGIMSREIIEYFGEQCVLETIGDVTEIKKLQQEMGRLGELNLVGEMAASIGHEIRNPMTTARGFLQMLSAKDECTQYKEYFDIIIEELDRANNIVTEFLSMTPKKHGLLKPVNLNTTIETLYPLIKADALIRDNQVHLELCIIPDLMLDESSLRQMILNLARNGIDAMSKGGILTISTYLEGDEVIMAVADQGKGMDQWILDKLGTPFFTTKENGTGLGLAVCYKIAEKNNSYIKVETGTWGTKFLVHFKRDTQGNK